METPPPSKSEAAFYEMQNKLHLIVTEQRHTEKKPAAFAVMGNLFYLPGTTHVCQG